MISPIRSPFLPMHGVSRGNARLPRLNNRIYCFLASVVILFLASAQFSLRAATLPTGFTESRVGGGLSSPTAMALAPDGRIFVCLQGGQVRVIKNGALLPTPFLSLSVDSNGERGLLGIAFDPNFIGNGYVYVYYTVATSPRYNRVSRFTANGDVVLAGSEVLILALNNLSSATNHNGGAMHFGPDGKLYVAVGENANSSNSQTLGNLLGKMLRINSDGSIPTDNPFYLTATGNNRAIWALGLRNPFTFSFQPGTGRMFINDVGESNWEEINDGIAGSNYGWPTCEGVCGSPSFRDPLSTYSHGNGCAITGGAFYNPATAQFPSQFVGTYFFADYCGGWIRRLDPASGSVTGFADGISSPVDLLVSDDGSLYYLAYSGDVYRVQYSANQAPQITVHPASRTVAVGQSVTFTVSASGSAPLSYQWQRNGSNISGATSSSYSIASAATADNGAQFRVVVSNSFGSDTSDNATLTVTNGAPTGTITSPALGALYNAGDTINYAGTGTDPQDGTLAASAFTWRVDFHHDTHVHPFIAPFSGVKSGSFVIPTTGHTEENVYYRIYLTVIDSSGLSHTSFRDISPRKSIITLQTNPAGLQITLEGQPQTTPYSVTSVVGVIRTLGVVSPQTFGGVTYEFVSWSDGGAATHNISTPAANATYTATYRVVGGGGGGNGLSAIYYNNMDFTGATLARIDPSVNFTWGDTSPAPGINAGTFSVRWTGQVQAQFSETYTFYTQTNDGIRLWINDQLIIQNWNDHALTEDRATIALIAGQKYTIKMEFYYNAGGAAARLLWSSASTPKAAIPQSQFFSSSAPPPPPPPPPPAGEGDGLSAVYYNNMNFSGATVTRIDPTVNFTWGDTSPAPGISPGTFSVRWTGQVQAEFSQRYTFYTQSNDGIRLWVNNQLIIQNWNDHALTENSGAITLVAGQKYAIKIEFYYNAGGAAARLLWSGASTPKTAIPQNRLFSIP